MAKKILIVDDESLIRMLLEQVLEDFREAGVEVLTASEGPQAWQIIQAEKPNVVILDVMLPGLSGHEICRRIRSDPQLVKTYVLMLTAKGQLIDRKQGLDAGADEYITKPFDPKLLVRCTAEALGFVA